VKSANFRSLSGGRIGVENNGGLQDSRDTWRNGKALYDPGKITVPTSWRSRLHNDSHDYLPDHRPHN
jgi:hypothetical protein